MRRSWIVAAVVCVIAIVVIIAVAKLLNVNRYKPQIEAELQSKLGRPVQLGNLHAHLFPFGVKIDGLTIGNAPGAPPGPPFAKADDVYVGVGLFSLIGGHPDVRDLTLDHPAIELVRNGAGVWNFSDFGKSSGNSGAKTGGGQSGFTLGKLKINDGQLAVTDESTHQPRTVYNHIDMNLSGLAPGKEMDVAMTAHFPGPGKEELRFTGKAGPLGAESKDTAVNGRLTVDEVSLTGLNTVAGGAIPPNTDASLSGDANVTTQNNLVMCQGNMKFANPVIQGTKVSYPIDAQYDLGYSQQQNQLQVRSGTVKLGSTVISVSGLLNEANRPATANLKMATTNASIAELAPVASAFGVTSFNSMDGKLAGDANLQFAMDQGPNMVRTLNGTVDLTLTNGRLKNVNILGELSRIGKFVNAGTAASGSGTTIQKASGRLNIQNGVATSNNLMAVLPEGSLSASGSLNLVTEAIDLRVNAVLASGVSKAVGGTQVGGLLSTVLANNNGELVVPVNVTGTMAHPVFTPDIQAMAKMKMGHLLPTSANPSSLTSGIVGSLLGGQQSNGAKKQEQNPINSILQQFGKKK